MFAASSGRRRKCSAGSPLTAGNGLPSQSMSGPKTQHKAVRCRGRQVPCPFPEKIEELLVTLGLLCRLNKFRLFLFNFSQHLLVTL